MVTDEIAARRLTILLEQYMETRKRRHDAVSTAAAEIAIRAVMPNRPISGKALDDMIAACPFERGVLFDRPDA